MKRQVTRDGAPDHAARRYDQRAGSHGRVGKFYPENGPTFEHWPASVAQLLDDADTALETGTPYDGRYQPRVTEHGILDWKIL